MKKTLLALATSATLAAPAMADVKLGIGLGFTGPLESLAPAMARGAELAIKEINEAGTFMGGQKITSVRGDTTCVDASAAVATAERLVTVDKVDALIGAMCSGATTAIIENVSKPRGILQFSPSATSPALSTIEDNGLFFRSTPSDARQGEIIGQMLVESGVKSAALTYTNNDYGAALADAIKRNFEALGGKITLSTGHEDGKADYAAEVGALSAAGGDLLIVAGYLDQGGKGVVQSALDTGAFDTFFFPDGMIGNSIVDAIGSDLDGTMGIAPGSATDSTRIFKELAAMDGFEPTLYAGEAYDAAALTLLAMHATGSTDAEILSPKIFELANAPGEPILPGELAKAMQILSEGGDIDLVGGSAIELIGGGESSGAYIEYLVSGGKLTAVGSR